jgi:beta-lactamase class C
VANGQSTADVVAEYFQPLVERWSSFDGGSSVGAIVGVIDLAGNRTYCRFGSTAMHNGSAVPATEDIVMMIGSNTKVFTATLLGLADWDPPPLKINGDTLVSDLLPTGTSIKQCDLPIALWHLGTHSAAYPDNLCGKAPFGQYSFTLMQDFLTAFDPPYAPGDYWHYSDQGFALLGVLLSHAYSWSGKTSTDWDCTYMNWPTWILEQVISPLKLTTTQVDYTPVINQFAQSYGFVAQEDSYRAIDPPDLDLKSAGLAAGALSSTLSDMLTFLEAQLIPPNSPIGSAILQTQFLKTERLHMGLGWQINNDYFDKNGLVNGFASWMAFDPNAGLGIMAMANTWADDKGQGLCRAGRQVLGALRGYTCYPAPFPVPPKELIPHCP